MSEPAAAIERAWRDGVGPDDLWAIDAAALAGIPDGVMFAACLRVLASVRHDVPPIRGIGPAAVVTAAAALSRARFDREREAIANALDELERQLALLAPDEPHAAAARAWADLALGQLALAINDRPTARRRLERVAEAGQPVALRIAAMLDLAGIEMGDVDVTAARRWVRKALTVAEVEQRPLAADRARLALGLLEAASGDQRAARGTLAAQAERSIVARVLLAGLESASDAMALLGEGIAQATREGDTFAYMLCILIGARRYVSIGRDADALLTISAGIVNLEANAPELAAALRNEREQWHQAWPAERWAAAEARAHELVG